MLETNPEYTGDDAPKNDRIIIQYFDKASALKLARRAGRRRRRLPQPQPDRHRGPAQSADGVEVVAGPGQRDPLHGLQPRPPAGRQRRAEAAIRQAVAQTIDRQSIVDNVYNGTVKPLYSMVPAGLDVPHRGVRGRVRRGARRRRRHADARGRRASTTPVPLEIWWTPTHYGTASGDEYAEIKRQLDESGLFKVTLKSTEWNQYSEAAFTDKYPQSPARLVPGLPGRRQLLGAFYSKASFLNIHYSNPEIDKLLAEEKASTDHAAARGGLRQDPGDRGRGRAEHPDLGGRAGRRGAGRASRASRRRSTRRSCSASG